MKKYKVFELKDTSAKIKGEVQIRLDEEDTSIFRKLKPLGLKFTKKLHKVEWIEDNYAEIVNRLTDIEMATLEVY